MKQLNAIKDEKNRMGMRFGVALKTLMLLAVFIGGMGTAWAQGDWSGNTAGRTMAAGTYNVTGTVTLTGTQIISSGTVTINASGANRTILRGAKNFAMFDVRSGGTLIINGGSYKITIDGNSGTYPGDSDSSVSGTTGQENSWGHSAVQVRVGGTARLTDVTIKNNYLKNITSVEGNPLATHGGAIFVRGTLECSNCTISNCRSTQGGGVCVFSGGNATITGGSIHDCRSFNRGGGACVINTTNNGGTGANTPSGSHATLTLSGVKIYNNTSPNGFGGGGYSEFVGANLIVKDNTEIYNNTSKSGGFGVTVADMGDIELRACDIHHNSSAAHTDYGGGGLYIGGTVNNDATAYVYEGCKIHHNEAQTGGGIYLAANMHLIVEGGEIYNNTTNGNVYGRAGVGGGVYMGNGQRNRASTFEMRGGKIYNNTATQRAGGGVYISQGTVTITGGEIYENNAGADGGGIYLNAGTVNMSGGAVYGNKANNSANNGGGLYLAGGDFSMSGTAKMYTNQANNGAGAYLAAGNFTMSGGEMYSNTAATNGGGIYLNNGTPTVSGTAKIYTNTAVNGGGLYLNQGTFKMQGGEVYGNTATTYGGGAYLTANCTFQITGGSLGKTGEANKNKATKGGGLYDLGTFTMSNGNIVNNEATTGEGGGAYIQTTVATPLSGGTVAGNTAATNGGGLYITGTSTATTAVTVSGTSFYGNTAPYGDGGGLYLESSATFTMNGGNIGVDGQAKNSAKRGGGVFDKGSFTMNSGNITNNEATNTDGGGAYVMTNQATTLKAGNVSNNTAKQHGGGLYITGNNVGGTAVTVSGVNIFGNNAAYNADGSLNTSGFGGGIYLDSKTGNSFTMTGGAIGTEGNPNKARRGGGAYIAAPFSMTGGSISYNQALSDIGGGAYINSTLATTISDATIKENTAATNGGGIYLANGSVTVTDATFEHNTANWQSGQGGGIYAAGSMTINGTSSFIKNEANLGGAATVNNGSFTMEGGIVGGSEANANKARRRGGGIYVSGTSSTVTLQGGEVSYNEALTATDGAGGGIYVNSSSSDGSQFTGAVKLNYNKALLGGGAYINAGNITINGTGVQVNNNQATGDGTEIMNGTTPSGIFTGDGGGMYVDKGSVTIKGTGVINNNYAGHDGGAIFTKNIGSSITIGESGSNNAFTLSENHADNWGGAIRVGGTITLYTGSLTKNYATYRGGGVFVAAGTYTMNGGTVGGTTANGNYTTAEGNAEYGGGGIFVLGGTANINNGAISGNHVGTGTCGGGVYMGFDSDNNTGGTCTIAGGTIGGSGQANSATYGGGIYSAGGTITVTQSTKNRTTGNISYNTATYGGGIYTNGDMGVVYVNHGDIEYNEASNGGGIYANRGLVDFSNGNIQYNYASNQGGGIYIHKNTDNTYGTLNLKGTAVLDRNYVPTGHKGGGVYLEGVVVVGDADNPSNLCSVNADENFAHTLEGSETVLTYTPDNNTRNNIYLPNPEVRTDHTSLITVIEDAIGTSSHIGFSVPHNHLPVIYCAPSSTSMTYLDKFTTGEGHILNTRLFDDTKHYLSVHYASWPEAFDRDHVYLYGFWPEAVTSQPAGYTVDGSGNVTISSAEGLAWLISTVNGYNEQTPNDFSGKTVNLTASVDMSDYGWVSVGFMGNASSTPKPFAGTFNGNGNTITGIDCMVYGSGVNGFIDYGLFGFVEGGTVENVFVKDAKFYLDDNANLVLGALVGELNGGTLCNSEASGMLISQTPDAIIGGAVGKMTTGSNGTVHSVISVAEMTGGTMGGLVGVLEAGNLYNSFANPKFNYTGTTQYFGGLVGVNGGTVENCYTRMQGATATTDGDAPASNYFGWFVGQNNTDGVVNYCYNREQTTNYIKSNLGKMNGSGYYANNTEVPYLYKRRDNQVTVDEAGYNESNTNIYVPADDKDHQLLLCLNRWVAAQNTLQGDHPTYTEWMRTTSKTINNDLPVLKMPFANSIVGTTSTVYLDYGDINDMMATYQAFTQALCLYQSKKGMNSNDGSAAKLYINEDVSVIPTERESGVINAYVGVTIANVAGADGAQPTFGGTDAIDWHMFATPLQAAPLGIDYHGDNTAYHGATSGYDYYGHYGPYYRFMQGDANGNIGYFPSHTYGQEYPASDASVVNGNYYPEWDFYTYYEPEYHWINFKRNSNDHWHENAHNVQIHYMGDGENEGNETELVQGRGYLVAFADSATYLQCHGELNTGADITIPVTMKGYYSTGYNLLGNPYQACLDFNAFAEYNSSDEDEEAIWSSVEEADYRILSETAKDYVTFAYGSSENPFGAGRYIHPHQGFMIYSTTNEGAVAYFSDLDGADGPHMRAINDATPFRSARINYPLVNLFATESNGNETMVTVELGRPDKGGAKLMDELRVGKGQMWCRYDDADWKLAYTRPGVSEVPIRFSTIEDTEYTMTWSTHNGEFSYMHLIDNLTGADVDCLSEREYKFSSKTSDFKSRFKLVFDYTGVEENDEAETQETTFAFIMGDELVVNGEGTLEMFDINGRQLMSTLTQGTQTTLHLPQVSTGVYVLRMTSNGQVKTQKMVINQ